MAAFQFPDPTVNQTVVNPITGSTYQWKEPPGKWVLIAQPQTQVSDIIWEGDSPPAPVGDYKLWYSTDTLELYFYYCDANGVCAWVPTSVPIQVLENLNEFAAQAEVDIDQLQYKQTLLQNALDQIYLDQQQDKYVKKEGGDSMEGPLVIQAQDPTDARATKRVDTLGVFTNSEGSALRLGTTRDRVYVGHDDVSINGPVKVGEIQEKSNGNGIRVSNDLTMSSNKLTGLPEAVNDSDAVPLVQLLENVNILQNEIIELEEEIDAIAPSVERGKWRFTAVGTVAQPGQFTMYDDEFGSGAPTGLFKSAKSIWFNEIDNEGTAHAFGDVDDGELLEIFVDGSPEFGLYEVIGKAHDETDGATSFWVIDVNFIRTIEDTAAIAPSELCRFKIFMAPTGGDASSFVMKTGDTMTGDLEILRKPEDDDKKSFMIQGKYTNGNVYDMFYAYRAADGKDDGVAYYGRQPDSETSAHIATTGFVAKKVNKAVQAAGLQLGTFTYRRSGDSFATGQMKSNVTTNPLNITQLDIHKTNADGIVWGTDLYEAVIREKMYVHFMDKASANYIGRITNIKMNTNSVTLTLNPMTDLINGSVYLNSKYEIFIGYNRFGFKYPA